MVAELLSAVLDAHGGLDHWREFRRVEATIVTGGDLWPSKGSRKIRLRGTWLWLWTTNGRP